jgi:hypothetical protein
MQPIALCLLLLDYGLCTQAYHSRNVSNSRDYIMDSDDRIDDTYLSQVFRATTAFMAGGRDLQAVEML